MQPHVISLRDKSCLSVDEKEVMRYLKITEPDELFKSLFDDCVERVKSVSVPRAVYIETTVRLLNDCVDLNFVKVTSKNLTQNLSECKCAFVFAATLGIEVDREYRRLERISQAHASVFNAVASSYIESFCDYTNEELVKGVESRPRFSPGYGDLCLSCQKEILSCLCANKHIGVTLTDSYIMIPAKSVTAIIGVK